MKKEQGIRDKGQGTRRRRSLMEVRRGAVVARRLAFLVGADVGQPVTATALADWAEHRALQRRINAGGAR